MLELHADYDRRAVHDIFDRNSVFTVGAGTWGLQGIVRVPGKPGDFVLFVTLGKQEGGHQFDESINEDGILRWQSQPQQDLSSPVIATLVGHDAQLNTVHLFLRTARLRAGVAPPFTYLGPLRYAGHDLNRAHPAHVAWELIAWPIPKEVRTRMRLELVKEITSTELTNELIASSVPTLIEEDAPSGLSPIGESTAKFQARKIRYQSSDQSRSLGLAGELLVLERERELLIASGRSDLAAKVEHTSILKGDGAGYDIGSFDVDGAAKYIEVKTTTGPKNSDFLISPNELAFSKANPASFELCRVFEFDLRRNSGRVYRMRGDMHSKLSLVETQFRARPFVPPDALAHGS